MVDTSVPVLLVHGIDDTIAVFDTLRDYLRDRGWPAVHALDLLPNNGDTGLDQLAEQVHDYVEQQLSRAPQIDLVGFSMGGLVGRYYIQRLGGLQRVRRFVTLSSPHNGTWTAFLRSNIGVSQMRPNSEFLRDLNDTVGELAQVEFASVWTPYDLMIVPTESSRLPIGMMRQLPVWAHPLMVSDERSLATVAEFLGDRSMSTAG